jgi:hypothetical protein
MSNTLIALLVVFAFATGLGLGLIVVMRPRAPSLEQKLAERQRREESTVYFGRDDSDPDHPHDIERAAAHRYDGMTDGDAPYIPSGLDFGREPR